GRRPGRATARPRDYGRLPRGARRARQARGSLGQILPNVTATGRPPEGVSRGIAVVAGMSTTTVGFAVADEDQERLARLVKHFGGGNRSAYLRATLPIMESLARAERLRELQARNAERVAALELDHETLLARIQTASNPSADCPVAGFRSAASLGHSPTSFTGVSRRARGPSAPAPGRVIAGSEPGREVVGVGSCAGAVSARVGRRPPAEGFGEAHAEDVDDVRPDVLDDSAALGQQG